MGRSINLRNVNTNTVIPNGSPLLVVDSIEEAESGAKNTGFLQFVAKYRIVEPAGPYKGLLLWDRFTVGDEDHPDDLVSTTIGMKNLRRLAEATEVGLDFEDTEELFEELKGKHFIGVTEVSGEGDKVYTNVRGYYKVGTRMPVLDEVKSASVATKVPAARAPRTMAARGK